MSRDASITFLWADGEYKFRLPIKQLDELDDLRKAGPAWLHAKIEAGMYSAADLVETIRLGLIGGGMKPESARTLVRRYVEDRPLHESVVPAMKILAAAVAGPEDEPLKIEGERTANRHSPEAKSGSQASTGPAP